MTPDGFEAAAGDLQRRFGVDPRCKLAEQLQRIRRRYDFNAEVLADTTTPRQRLTAAQSAGKHVVALLESLPDLVRTNGPGLVADELVADLEALREKLDARVTALSPHKRTAGKKPREADAALVVALLQIVHCWTAIETDPGTYIGPPHYYVADVVDFISEAAELIDVALGRKFIGETVREFMRRQ